VLQYIELIKGIGVEVDECRFSHNAVYL